MIVRNSSKNMNKNSKKSIKTSRTSMLVLKAIVRNLHYFRNLLTVSTIYVPTLGSGYTIFSIIKIRYTFSRS